VTDGTYAQSLYYQPNVRLIKFVFKRKLSYFMNNTGTMVIIVIILCYNGKIDTSSTLIIIDQTDGLCVCILLIIWFKLYRYTLVLIIVIIDGQKLRVMRMLTRG